MTAETILGLVLLPPLAYALGSIPFGLLIARGWGGPDLRRSGSGNIGATNVRRSLGNGAALLTLAGDALKGMLPLWLAQNLLGASPGTLGQCHLAVVALGAFLGHLYPIYLGGRGGGKGVATAGGAMAVLAPGALATALLVFILVACWSNRASLASLAAAVYLPLGVWLASQSGIFTACAGLMAALIVWRHRDNLRRLQQGTEPRIWAASR
jgi:glycerol-3-phosphate acyltransferase PlsY